MLEKIDEIKLAKDGVKELFEKNGIKIEKETENMLVTSWNFNGGSIRVFLSFSEDIVHLEGLNFIDIDQSQWPLLYETVNALNSKYLFCKFVLDSDYEQLCIRTDAHIDYLTVGHICYSLLKRTVQVAEDALPTINAALQ